MKFNFFHLMPYTDLPLESRGWPFPNRHMDPVKAGAAFRSYIDAMVHAESCGFDWIGCNEHHFSPYGMMANPNLVGAALAYRTSRAKIAMVGNLTPLNNPIRVAEEYAMLDCMSGGRLVAGFPVGTSMDTNYCYGQIPALTREKYAEAHDLLDRYLKTHVPTLGERTQADYHRHVRNLRAVFGNEAANRVQPRDIGRYLAIDVVKGRVHRVKLISILSTAFAVLGLSD